jgi:hypothetical protein
VGDCKAVGGNELMFVQFLIHPFEALINDRSLGFAIFRKLSKAVLKQWIGIFGPCEPIGEPTVDRGEKLAGLLPLTQVTPADERT